MVVKLDRVRYIKTEFFGEPVTLPQFINSLRNNVRNLAGEIFLANSSLHVIEYNNSHSIVRCNHLSRDVIEAAIQLIQFENFIPVVRKVSGTLKTFSETAKDISEDSETDI